VCGALLLCLGAAAWGAGPLEAQTLGYSGGAGASFESYTFSEPEAIGVRRLSLCTLPFGTRLQAAPRLSFEVTGAFAQGGLTRDDGSSATISGVTDTELRGSFTLLPGVMTISITGLLPTGRATQRGDEAEVAGRIASELLPFRITNWGSGGGIGIATIVAIPVQGFGVGVSAGYTVAREFQPLESPSEQDAVAGEWHYRPGNTFRLQLGVDRTLGRATKATLLLGLQQHAADAAGSSGTRENVYRPGDRYQAIGSLAYAAGRTASAVSYLGVQHRNAGTFMVESMRVPAQKLILAGTQVRLPTGRGVLLPGVDARLFRRADGRNQGYLAGIGAAAEWPLGGLIVIPNARGWFGKMNFWEGNEAAVWGSDLGVTVRLGGRAR
jgi:hypothetical protein